MKKLFLSTVKYSIIIPVFLLSALIVQSQNVGVNSTGAAPVASAMLDVTSTTSGFLVPRMTQAQKNGIGAPATGLLIYQTDATAGFWYYNGVAWVQLGGNDGDWTISGINQYSAVSGNVGIGTVAPAYKLQVMGNAGFNDYLYHNGDANTYMLYTADLVRFYAGGLRMLDLSEAATDQVVINENSADIDFRVESNARAAQFIINSGTEFAGLRWNNAGDEGVHWDVNGAATYGGDYATYRALVGWYFGGDPILIPNTDWWGYVGGVADAWYRGYSYGWFNVSDRKKKRDITPINDDDALAAWVMNDIDKIKPSFYKYIHQKDELLPGYETKYRPMMSIGVITDEAPDYILDEGFGGVDIYGIATLSLAGVKYNRKEIQEIKTALGMNITINDFGSKTMSGTEVWVDYSDDFSGKLSGNVPIITVTGSNPSVTLSIAEKTGTGFRVTASESTSNLAFDWIAMSKVQTAISSGNENLSISPGLRDKLKVPAAKKQIALDWWNSEEAKKAMKSSMSNNPEK